MSKKNKQFFWTNISEDDMKDNGLFITGNTRPIPMGDGDGMFNYSTWEQVKLETNWDEKEKEWDEWMLKFRIRNQKGMKRSSILGVLVGLFGTVSAYTSSVLALNSLDSSYADSANVYIGFSAVGFALLSGYMAYTFITSSFDWFKARKKLKELNS
jgi:hypothetical protein